MQIFASSAHPYGAVGKAHRYICAEAAGNVHPIDRGGCLRCAVRIARRAAAASAEPPPIPDATGRCFFSVMCPMGRPVARSPKS